MKWDGPVSVPSAAQSNRSMPYSGSLQYPVPSTQLTTAVNPARVAYRLSPFYLFRQHFDRFLA